MKKSYTFLLFIFFGFYGYGQLASCPDNLTRTCTVTKTTLRWNPGTTCGQLPNTIEYTDFGPPVHNNTLNKSTIPPCNNSANGVTYSINFGGGCTIGVGFSLDFTSIAGAGPVCHYNNAGLPVTLTSFKSAINKNTIHLLWHTEAELDNAGFEIQRSFNAKDWETIAFITGQGSTIEKTNYSYIDESPLKGIQYYRLNQVDYDGKSSYSPVISTEFQLASKVAIYPNPAKDKLSIKIETTGENTVTIFDNMGRKVLKTILNEREIDISSLEAGIYFVQITNGNRIEKVRFVKE